MDIREEAKRLADEFEARTKEAIQDQIAAYAAKGRKYAAIPTPELQARYIASLADYCASEPPDPSKLAWDEIGSELTIRKAEVSYEVIRDQRKVLVRRAIEALQRAKADPETTARLFEGLLKDRGIAN